MDIAIRISLLQLGNSGWEVSITICPIISWSL